MGPKRQPPNIYSIEWLAILGVVAVMVLLALTGCLSSLLYPSASDEIWGHVTPVLTSTLSGLLGYGLGQAQKKT